TSNMRLASGIAPVQRMRAAGVKVGLGVDGSASNDGSHLLAEARQAMLLARLGLAEDERRQTTDGSGKTHSVLLKRTTRRPPLSSSVVRPSSSQMTAREALEIATLGGAAVLGRDDIGSLASGKCADFFALNLNRLEYAGALHDPVAAVLFCAPQRADYMVIHGRAIVKDGQLATVELPRVIEQHNHLARQMVNGD
ncbi:MAG: amidohydrolase family protein, partial [Anaerolineales bacterium]